MRFFQKIMLLGCSLLYLASCTSTTTRNSIIDTQVMLLTEFEASLTKIVAIEGKGIDSITVSSDSIAWNKELEFLSYFDLLNESNFEVTHTYSNDSSITSTTYTPKGKSLIQLATIDFRKKATHYTFQITKDKLTQKSELEIDINFASYQNQKIVQSYSVIGFQKSPFSDSLFYSIEGQIGY